MTRPAGRQTGSTEWKASRGELGRKTATGADAVRNNNHPRLQDDRDLSSRQDATNGQASRTTPTATSLETARKLADPGSAPPHVAQDSVNADRPPPHSRDEFTERMQRLFAELTAAGHPPNEAALLALQQLKEKSRD